MKGEPRLTMLRTRKADLLDSCWWWEKLRRINSEKQDFMLLKILDLGVSHGSMVVSRSTANGIHTHLH